MLKGISKEGNLDCNPNCRPFNERKSLRFFCWYRSPKPQFSFPQLQPCPQLHSPLNPPLLPSLPPLLPLHHPPPPSSPSSSPSLSPLSTLRHASLHLSAPSTPTPSPSPQTEKRKRKNHTAALCPPFSDPSTLPLMWPSHLTPFRTPRPSPPKKSPSSSVNCLPRGSAWRGPSTGSGPKRGTPTTPFTTTWFSEPSAGLSSGTSSASAGKTWLKMASCPPTTPTACSLMCMGKRVWSKKRFCGLGTCG